MRKTERNSKTTEGSYSLGQPKCKEKATKAVGTLSRPLSSDDRFEVTNEVKTERLQRFCVTCSPLLAGIVCTNFGDGGGERSVGIFCYVRKSNIHHVTKIYHHLGTEDLSNLNFY